MRESRSQDVFVSAAEILVRASIVDLRRPCSENSAAVARQPAALSSFFEEASRLELVRWFERWRGVCSLLSTVIELEDQNFILQREVSRGHAMLQAMAVQLAAATAQASSLEREGRSEES